MQKTQAIDTVKKTFTQSFDKEQFHLFVVNLLNHLNDSEERHLLVPNARIKEAYRERVNHYERLGTFTDPEGKLLDVLVIYLKKDTTLERGRTFLRNFAADYLATGHGSNKDAILAAYVAPDEADWRFSYVKLETALEQTEDGKVSVRKELTPARRYSFLVGANERSHTAQKQFLSLLENDQSDPLLGDIEKAFNIETVTKEFFARYKELFDETRKSLEKICKKDKSVCADFEKKDVSIDDFAKKLLGQIVFLYFLQKKGWFGVEKAGEWGSGDKRFLRHLFDNRADYVSRKAAGSGAVNFFNNILEPLFYETLATPRSEDFSSQFDCKIPFLNGGLFEPLYGYDWQNTDILLPDALFSNTERTKEGDSGTGILDVFDRYNFTVNESEPLETEVAVDPEMLGKVFENLLPENERHGKGTYYTPRPIVAYMCQQSLINYLATHLEAEKVSRDSIETFVLYGERYADFEAKSNKANADKLLPEQVRKHAAKIDQKLAEIKVCDPAIGSGAFPVGMMQEIVRARLTVFSNEDFRKTLTEKQQKNHTAYQLKRHAIENSIYGVDLDSGAVEIAKLRLWLSLVVDEEDRRTVHPLPNLDFKIMQGNSLLDEFRGIRLFDDSVLQRARAENPEQMKAELKRKIAERSQEFFALHPQGTGAAIKRHAVEQEIVGLKKQLDALTATDNGKTEKNSLYAGKPETSRAAERLAELREIHQAIIAETRGEKKRNLRKRADRLEHEFVREHLRELKTQLSEEIENLQAELDDETANVNQKMKSVVETAKMRSLRKRLDAKRRELTDLNDTQREVEAMDFSKSKPFFLWHLQFFEIFQERGGFDVVMGNPPYMRVQGLQETQPELVPSYRAKYKSAQGSFDIYALFIEWGYQLLNSTGEFAYIVPHKFFQATFGSALRELLMETNAIRHVVRFGAEQVFENPTTYTCLFFLSKQSHSEFDLVEVYDMSEPETLMRAIASKKDQQAYEVGIFSAPQTDDWDFTVGKKNDVLNRIAKQDINLGNITRKIFQGIPTGSDKIFVLEVRKKKRDTTICYSKILEREVEIENKLLKPFLMGKDVHRYETAEVRNAVIFPYLIGRERTQLMPKEFIRKNFPLAWDYLRENKRALSERENGRFAENWYCFSRPQNLNEFEAVKIMTPEIALGCQMTIDAKGELYHTTKVYSFVFLDHIKDDPKYFLGILNSKILWFFIQATGYVLRGGYFTFKTEYLRPFPIPCSLSKNPPSPTQQKQIALLVDYVLFAKANADENDSRDALMISYFEQIVDALCYELYLADEIHKAEKYFFKPLAAENLPAIREIKGNKLDELRRIFERLFDRESIIRQNIFFLDTIESVRIIEGKA